MAGETLAGVRRATRDDVPRMAQSLHRAFFDDPIVTWMMPDEQRRRRRGARGFETWLRRLYLPKGEVYTDEANACAALWAPPGKWKTPPAKQVGMLPAMARIFGVRRLPLILEGLTYLEKNHPDDQPHWYLGILGTDPEHQGKGIGAAVMRVVLDRCDAEGVPAYLESSKPDNVPYYQRHGFEVVAELQLPEGPPFWPMWREPRLPDLSSDRGGRATYP